MMAFLLVVSFDNGSAQLFLILLLNLVNIIYYAKVQPYAHIHWKQYNNYIILHNLASVSLIIICIIILELRNTYFTYDTRVTFGNIIAGLVMYSFTVNIIYFFFRAYHWYHDNVWRPFVATDMFMENYTIQYWDYKKAYDELDKEEKKKSGRRE